MTEFLEPPALQWPVVVEFTQHKVVWIEAESQEAAVEQVKGSLDDGSDMWEQGDDCDVWSGLQITDGWQARYMVDDAFARVLADCGPVERCPACGTVALGIDADALRWAKHDERCPAHRHRVDLLGLMRRDESGAPIQKERAGGFALACSCGEPGTVERFSLSERPCIGDPGAPEPLSREEASRLASEHVDGRPHGKNVQIGVMDNYVGPHPRTLAPAVRSSGHE